MCLHTPNLAFLIVCTQMYAGFWLLVFFFFHTLPPQKMVQCRQKIGWEWCNPWELLLLCPAGSLAFWMYPGKFSEQVSQQVGAASPRTCLRVNLKGAHWQRAGLYPRLHPQHFNVPLQPLLPFTALCDACGFSKQKMFMRRVYFRLPFMTAQTPLQADGLTVARKLFISQKQHLKFLFLKKKTVCSGCTFEAGTNSVCGSTFPNPAAPEQPNLHRAPWNSNSTHCWLGAILEIQLFSFYLQNWWYPQWKSLLGVCKCVETRTSQGCEYI